MNLAVMSMRSSGQFETFFFIFFYGKILHTQIHKNPQKAQKAQKAQKVQKRK